MTKWEYHIFFSDYTHSLLDVDEWINELGTKGWELVSVTDRGAHYFKRPLEPVGPFDND